MVSLRLPAVAEVESLKLNQSLLALLSWAGLGTEDRTLLATHFGHAMQDLGTTHSRTLAAVPLLWQSPRLLQARRLRHGSRTSRGRTCQTCEKSRAEASGHRASRRLPRGERRGHCRLCQGHRPVLCVPPGWSSMRPCSIQMYQCSRLRMRRFSVCLRVAYWEVIEPSRPTSPRQKACTCWRATSGRRSFPQGSALRLEVFGRVEAVGSI